MGRKFFFGFILLFSYFFFIPYTVGEVYANHCTAPRPGSAPLLTSAVPAEKSVTLTWIEAQDPVTYYLLAYGTSPTAIEYGAPNIGGRGTTSFTVSELTNGVKYYFRVRGVNGCKPGKFSNKLSAVPGVRFGAVTGTQKPPSQGPNLSIYKPVLSASTAAVPKKTEKKKETIITQSASLEKCAVSCAPWPLLVGEAIFLVMYFYFANRFRINIRPIFSIIIPTITYLVFLSKYGACSSQDFSCKYFLPLSILVFMLIVIIRKHQFLKGDSIQRLNIIK